MNLLELVDTLGYGELIAVVLALGGLIVGKDLVVSGVSTVINLIRKGAYDADNPYHNGQKGDY